MKSKINDNIIVDGFKYNDNEIIEYFKRKFKPVIFSMFIKIGIENIEDQKEIFSRVLIAFWQNCKSEKGLILTCKLSTYISYIARNLALKYINDTYNKRKELLNDDIHDTGYHLKSDFLDKDIKVELLKNSIKKLDKDKQKFLNLLFDGKSGKEIAKEMNFSNTNVVKTKKYKIVKELKKMCLI